MTFSKKNTAIPLSLILLCVLARGFLIYYMSIAPLGAFCKELATDSLTDNPFELHYTIANPENMGFSHLSHNLIPFQENAYAQSKAIWDGHAETLSKIASSNLKEDDLFLYDLLSRFTALQLEGFKFPYYENPVSCSGGVQSQIPILLSEYAFRSKEDVENYFLLLTQIPAYLEGIFSYMEIRERNGIYSYSENIHEAARQCFSMFPENELETGTHFLQTSFKNRIQELVKTETINSKEANDYNARNNAILKNQLAPAYITLANSLKTLKGTPHPVSLYTYPKGKDYYALLLASNTGSDQSIEDLQSMLYQRYDMLYNRFTTLIQKGTSTNALSLPLEKPSDILQHLYQSTQEHFPELSLITENITQQVQLKHVDGILADMSAPAFYMTPPIDANDIHTIYINPNSNMQSLDLYTTLAHEGFPGHLYQTVYSQTALSSSHTPLIRQLLYYGGYTEGWAVYTELYSYDFLKDLFGETAAEQLEIARLNREIQLCLCSILDIYIHHEGASLSDVQKLMQTLGLNITAVDAIYQSICDAPANYPKYYIGYLEILRLKETAKGLWSEDFSDIAFHKWLLEAGPGDFSSLENKLKRDQ